MTNKQNSTKASKIKDDTSERQRVNQKFDAELLIEEEMTIEDSELVELKRLFEEQDADKDSKLSFKEVQELCKKFGKLEKNEDENLKNLFTSITKEYDQKLVDEENFLKIYKLILKERKIVADAKSVMEAFKMFDRDGNGKISVEEMKYILASLGESYSEKEVDEVFKEADLNKDGNIDYDEFVQFWRNNYN